MDAWEVLVSNSSLPESSSNDAWEHLNNQVATETSEYEYLVLQVINTDLNIQIIDTSIYLQNINSLLDIQIIDV